MPGHGAMAVPDGKCCIWRERCDSGTASLGIFRMLRNFTRRPEIQSQRDAVPGTVNASGAMNSRSCARTASTGHGAVLTTRSATLPINR